jgi:hypothetical protein
MIYFGIVDLLQEDTLNRKVRQVSPETSSPSPPKIDPNAVRILYFILFNYC